MAATDVEERLAQGLVAIVNGLTGLQAVMGRATQLIVAWQAMEAVPGDVTLPVIAYQVVSHQTQGGAGDNRRIGVTFSCVAQGPDALATTRAMVEQLELGLTQPAFAAQGLDAIVLRPWSRLPVGQDPELTRGLARSDVDVDVWITK